MDIKDHGHLDDFFSFLLKTEPKMDEFFPKEYQILRALDHVLWRRHNEYQAEIENVTEKIRMIDQSMARLKKGESLELYTLYKMSVPSWVTSSVISKNYKNHIVERIVVLKLRIKNILNLTNFNSNIKNFRRVCESVNVIGLCFFISKKSAVQIPFHFLRIHASKKTNV